MGPRPQRRIRYAGGRAPPSYAGAMCGRFVSFSDPEQLAERFEIDEVRTDALPERYNVAPTLDIYAVIETSGSRRLGTLRWGFVPPWSKDPKKGPINARVEGLCESKMFAPALQRRRCLLPADGFYEWQEQGEGRRKQPYYLHDPEGEPLAFAGLYSSWRPKGENEDEDAGPLFSCAIVTTEARGEMERIHHRSPLILPRRLWPEWLTASPEEASRLRDTVANLGPPRLVAQPISDRVNNVRNEGPELLEPGQVEP
jgi:putative SOS response-associated peptidase YedK